MSTVTPTSSPEQGRLPTAVSGIRPRNASLRPVDPDLLDEDASLRANLARLGETALRELLDILQAPQTYRDALQQAMLARPALHDLSVILAMADTDEVVRLRLLRALRDLGVT